MTTHHQADVHAAMRRHPAGNQLPRWQCKHCGQPFTEFSDVTRHIRDTHGINPFAPVSTRQHNQP